WGLTFLQGDPQAFAVVPPLLIVTAFAVKGTTWRRTAALFGVSFAVALLIISPELLPSLAVSSESARAVGTRSPLIGLTWAFHPLRAFELLCSGFVPDLVRNEFTQTFFSGDRALW